MTPGTANFAAVILAAGASSRMGSPKALLDTGAGESFLDRLAGVFLEAGCSVYVVVGEDAAPIAQAIRRHAEITLVRNPDPSRGQLSSLQCGLRAAAGVDAIFFTPVDAPGISRETILLLKDFLAGKDFAIPIYEGKRGHPVLMSAACAAEFLEPAEGATARDILHSRRASTRFVEVADPGILEDIDDPQAYELWLRGGAGFSLRGASAPQTNSVIGKPAEACPTTPAGCSHSQKRAAAQPLPHGRGSEPIADSTEPIAYPSRDREGAVAENKTIPNPSCDREGAVAENKAIPYPSRDREGAVAATNPKRRHRASSRQGEQPR